MGCRKLTYRSESSRLKVISNNLKIRSESCVGMYTYGFNGMRKDAEVSGEGNSYTTQFRQYDPRLGRWKSIDPLMAMFPHQSPYVAFDNNPIYYTDPLGLAAEGGPGGDGGGKGNGGDGPHTTYSSFSREFKSTSPAPSPSSGVMIGAPKVNLSVNDAANIIPGEYRDLEGNYLGTDHIDDGMAYNITKDDYESVTLILRPELRKKQLSSKALFVQKTNITLNGDKNKNVLPQFNVTLSENSLTYITENSSNNNENYYNINNNSYDYFSLLGVMGSYFEISSLLHADKTGWWALNGKKYKFNYYGRNSIGTQFDMVRRSNRYLNYGKFLGKATNTKLVYDIITGNISLVDGTLQGTSFLANKFGGHYGKAISFGIQANYFICGDKPCFDSFWKSIGF